MPAPLHSLPADQPREAHTGWSGLGVRLATAGLSFLLLVPCFWQAHIEAGDLASHLYNAWLARLVAAGSTPGLALAHVWTNVLADWILTALLGVFSVAWTERIFVSCAALTFFWGAFFLMRAAGRRWPWQLTPILAMLTYGLVFHLGFLNFYLSTALCLWSLGLLWQPSWTRAAWAVPLLALAFLAHALPLLWALAVFAYMQLCRRLPAWASLVPPGVALILLGAGSWLLPKVYFVQRRPSNAVMDLLGITGVEQVALFGGKYMILAAGLAMVLLALFLKRMDERAFWSDALAQLWLIHMAAFLLLPDMIRPDAYDYPLAFIPERISLFTALMLCALLAGTVSRPAIAGSVAVAGLYFAFVFVDARANNLLERQVTDLVAQLPPGQRVVAAISETGNRIGSLSHVIDRVCIGRCFSFANYEPATKQFRIRAQRPNPYVASSMAEVEELAGGAHIVTPGEAPLYSICRSESNPRELKLFRLDAGDRVCSFSLQVSPSVGRLVDGDQNQIPDDQRAIPVVDQAQHADALPPNAIAAQR